MNGIKTREIQNSEVAVFPLFRDPVLVVKWEND